MPIYEYQCQSCDTVFEEWQSGFEEKEMQCPECGQPAKRLISHTSFQLKGAGWYVTDYAGKKPSGGDAGGDTSSKDNGNGKDAKPDSGGKPSACPAAKASDSSSAGSASE